MREEYASLRDELLQWQEYRFLLLGFMMALVGAMLGFDLKDIRQFWFVLSAVGLLLLAIAGFVSWYAGDGNTKLAAYICVFYEDPTSKTDDRPAWETRLTRYNKLKKEGAFSKGPIEWGGQMNLNRWIALAYLFLGLIVAAVPWISAEYHSQNVAEQASVYPVTAAQLVLIWVAFVMFVIALLALFFSGSKERYICDWRRVREDETTKVTPTGSR
jgi:hypothetical protein